MYETFEILKMCLNGLQPQIAAFVKKYSFGLKNAALPATNNYVVHAAVVTKKCEKSEKWDMLHLGTWLQRKKE